MATIFTKIVKGEIPCYKVAETDDYLAFLDINPLQEGHTLVIPKQEVSYLFNLNDEAHAGLWNFAKKVAKAIECVVPCQRIGVTVIGLEVPHAHIHLIPISGLYDMDFTKHKKTFTPEQFQETARKISEKV